MLKKLDIYADAKQFLLEIKNGLEESLKNNGYLSPTLKGELSVLQGYAPLLNQKYVHFELPNNGARLIDLIDGKPTEKVISDYISGSHLPFDRVCFEFELDDIVANDSDIRAVAILAHEGFLDDGKTRAIILNIISQTNKQNTKGKSKYVAIANAQPAYIIIDEEYLKANPKDSYGILMSDGKTRTNDHSYPQKDSYTEAALVAINTVIAALAALSCSNVKVDKGFPPSITDNNKRIKKGIVPYTQKNYISFSVETEVHGSNPNKGSNTKKATHIRRGHIRRYQSGKKIWVESTVINGGAGEAKPKKYKIQ